MRQALMFASAAAAMLTLPAMADDRPAGAARFAGCYGGFNAGGAQTTADVSYIQSGGFFITSPPGDLAYMTNLASPRIRGTGFTGGGQLGCNYQTGRVVWGIETDINYLHTAGGYFATGVIPSNAHVVTSTVEASTDWLYTLRGRVGFTVERTLFYATGGLAAGNEKFSQNFFHFFNFTSEAGSASATKAGWTVGGGIEYAFTDSLSAKVEYLHVDLGSASFNSTNSLLPTYFAANSAHFREDIVRLGVNWKFISF
jgi:outer membrane immunogenic protein